MLVVLENVLSKSEVKQFRAYLDDTAWIDGQKTAGSFSRKVKSNQQLDEDSDIAVQLGEHILKALGNHAQFISASLAEKIYPPKFNRYSIGETYGLHVDSAVMRVPHQQVSLRSDVSATLFLSEKDEYEGGELTIQTEFGEQSIKLNAGDMVLYPSSSLHQVLPITKGARVSSFFWMQSMVRSAENRKILYELDQEIQNLQSCNEAQASLLGLSGVYHNLLRQWAEV